LRNGIITNALRQRKIICALGLRNDGIAPQNSVSPDQLNLKESQTMSASEAVLIPAIRTMRFRLLGVLPLAFFLARAIQYVYFAKTPEQILWSCHISNLMLAIGIFLANPFLIRISAFWQILGLPPWIVDMVMSGLITPISIFTHLGGCVMAFVALWQARAKLWSWVPSLIYFLVLQQITRLLTEPTIYTNVNVAHFAYGPWKDLFSSYWKYLLVNTAILAAGMLIIDYVLSKLFPLRQKD
jgi:hypothetical protein